MIPAPIRERFSLSPAQRLEWIVEADGSIRVVPVDPSPVKAFRGRGRCGGSTERLLADRVFEIGERDGDLVVIPCKELLHHKLGNGLDLEKGHGIFHREVSDDIALYANKRLTPLVANRDKVGLFPNLIHGKTKQVRVEGTAESLVRSHENDKLTFT